MSNETDLDWLARTEHHWPEDAVYVSRHENAVEWHYVELAFKGLGHFTKDQWLACRAELQNKPSWNDAPEWATNLVQIGSGAWVWCDNDRLEMKFGNGDRFDHSGNYGEVLGDWRDTLEKRPEEFQTFTSIEDNQEKDMKQDSGWFERGELPPVGVDCQAYVDERWVDAYVVGFIKNGAVTVDVRAYQGGVKSGLRLVTRNAAHFRPIRTERDVLIEIIKKTDDTDDKIADAILAAGFSLGAK